jgi:hypothetical protein
MLYSDDVLRKVINIAKSKMVLLYWLYCVIPLCVILSELSENPYKTPLLSIFGACMYVILLLSERRFYLLIKSIVRDSK